MVLLARKSRRGSLAQLVEHRAFNPLVLGSNPRRPTIFPSFLARDLLLREASWRTVLSKLPFSSLSVRLAGPDLGVWRIHYEALKLQEAGEDVILMSVGDPDFSTPDDIVDVLVQNIRAGRTHYSPAAGEIKLRQAIADLETSGTGKPFTAEQFVILPGATAAVYATLNCICDPGDEVIIPEPMYIGYRPIISALGLTVKSLDLDLHNDCALDIDELLALVTDRTRAVIINTPGNPFGNMMQRQDMTRLAAELLQRGVWMISDEVYSLFTYDAPHVSLLKAAQSLENVVVIDGLSKSHAMTGWRIGWAFGPPSMIEALTAYCGSAFFGCSQFIQDAAAYALEHNGPHVDRMCEAYRERRDLVINRVEAMPQLSYVRPQAGMFMMLNVSQIAADGGSFAEQLLAEQRVSVIPGAGFGDVAAPCVRLSLTHNMAVIEQAMDRIEAFVSSRAGVSGTAG